MHTWPLVYFSRNGYKTTLDSEGNVALLCHGQDGVKERGTITLL